MVLIVFKYKGYASLKLKIEITVGDALRASLSIYRDFGTKIILIVLYFHI